MIRRLAILLCATGALLACAVPARAGYDSLAAADQAKIRSIAEMHAAIYGVDPCLVLAVIRAESAFDRYALSPKGARGVMQLMPNTGQELGVADVRSLNDNIEAGVRYLRELLDRFRDPALAVAAYNAGPAAVEKFGGVPPFGETREYVARVMAFRAQEIARGSRIP